MDLIGKIKGAATIAGGRCVQGTSDSVKSVKGKSLAIAGLFQVFVKSMAQFSNRFIEDLRTISEFARA